jgi:hypothetical protein
MRRQRVLVGRVRCAQRGARSSRLDLRRHEQGDARTTALLDFATDLSDSHLDRLLAGLVERVHTSEVVRALRTRLYETGTSGTRAILEAHLDPADVDPSLELLTGAVFVRVTFEGADATAPYIDDLVDRVLRASESW